MRCSLFVNISMSAVYLPYSQVYQGMTFKRALIRTIYNCILKPFSLRSDCRKYKVISDQLSKDAP